MYKRQDLDEVILVVDAQMPVRARRIKYFEDSVLQPLHAEQSGTYPYPDPDRIRYEARLKETEDLVGRLSRELQAVRQDKAEASDGTAAAAPGGSSGTRLRASLRREAASAAPQPIQLDLKGLDGAAEGRRAIEAAVMKTTEILAAHGRVSYPPRIGQ